MAKKDPRIDAYIARAPAFAKPILIHLRRLVHKACPNVEETIKWGMPTFEHEGIVCSMAAFKAHCAFAFPKAGRLTDADAILERVGKSAMGHLGRITSKTDLPREAVLVRYLKEAVTLNEQPTPKATKTAARKKAALAVPAVVTNALRGNSKALATFKAFSASHKREYIEWITEAKTDATRDRRIRTMLEWLAEGKPRHWRYMGKG